MPFDLETAFMAISNVADMPMMLVVIPNVDGENLAEFVALAREAGQAQFRLARHRHHRASRVGDVHARRQDEDHTFP